MPIAEQDQISNINFTDNVHSNEMDLACVFNHNDKTKKNKQCICPYGQKFGGSAGLFFFFSFYQDYCNIQVFEKKVEVLKIL